MHPNYQSSYIRSAVDYPETGAAICKVGIGYRVTAQHSTKKMSLHKYLHFSQADDKTRQGKMSEASWSCCGLPEKKDPFGAENHLQEEQKSLSDCSCTDPAMSRWPHSTLFYRRHGVHNLQRILKCVCSPRKSMQCWPSLSHKIKWSTSSFRKYIVHRFVFFCIACNNLQRTGLIKRLKFIILFSKPDEIGLIVCTIYFRTE